MNESYRDLLALVPPIRRARGFRLYTAAGRRFVDLWQYGGAAVLGHTAPGVLLSLKDTASRGLSAPLPHPAGRRLEQALLRLFPGRAVRLYADEASVDRALASAGRGDLRFASFVDPALTDVPAGAFGALWRPWAPESDVRPAALAPVLPVPWPGRPAALLLDASVADAFPPSDILSPVALAAAGRAVDDLRAALPVRAEVRFGRIDAALSEGGPWTRRGPYLRPERALSGEGYATLFRRFLGAGFLLPPDAALPAILPGELSAGEVAALAALLRESTSEIL